MNGFACDEVFERLDDFRGGGLSEGDRVCFEAHLETCADCAEEIAVLDTITRGVEASTVDPITARRVAVSVMNPERDVTPPRRQVRLVPALGLSLVAAIVLLFLIVPWGQERSESVEHQVADGRLSSQAGPVSEAPAPEVEREVQMEVGTSADGRRFVEVFEGTALWMEDGALVGARQLGGRAARFELRRGRVVASIGEHHEPGFSFVVATPSGARVEARGTVFAVDASDSGEEARVLKGTVEVFLPSGKSFLLDAGNTADINTGDVEPTGEQELAADMLLAYGRAEEIEETKTTAASPRELSGTPEDGAAKALAAIEAGALDDAKEILAGMGNAAESRKLLIKLARAYRRARMYEAAAGVYRRMIASFPGSASADTAAVSLAQMELDTLGSPAAAVGHFDRYLSGAPTGYLAETARADKIRALMRLGRTSDALAAVEDFIASHPGKQTARMLRQRGDLNVRLGRCDRAVDDFTKVTTGWPGSGEATKAALGLASCDK